MSLESPPTENGHSLSEIISTVLPEDATNGDSQQSGAQSSGSNGKGRGGNNPASHAHLSNNGNVHNGHGPDMFAQQNRAPGSQFRNGSITVRKVVYRSSATTGRDHNLKIAFLVTKLPQKST